MIKNVLLASAALAVFSTAAVAADLPSRRAPPVYIAPVLPAFSWTGFYFGATAGYAFNSDTTFNTVGNTPAQIGLIATGVRPGFIRNRASGFTGGGEIGYNYEFLNSAYFGGNGGVVVGVEADAAYVGSGTDTIYTGTTGAPSDLHSRLSYLGTVRGRLGYAFDNFLVYGTGGLAYGGLKDSAIFLSTGGAAGPFSGSTSTTRTGYAYGGGIAYAIPTTSFLNFFKSSAVTLKAEFIHYDLGTTSFVIANTTGLSYTSQVKTTGNLVRAGIDYKFDFTPTPVVARY